MSAVDVIVTVLVTTLTQSSSRLKMGGIAETSAASRKNATRNIGQAIILGAGSLWKKVGETGLEEGQ